MAAGNGTTTGTVRSGRGAERPVRAWATGLVALGLAVSLAGCGGAGSTSSAAAPTPVSPAAADTAEPSAGAPSPATGSSAAAASPEPSSPEPSSPAASSPAPSPAASAPAPAAAAPTPPPARPTEPPKPKYLKRGASGPEVLALQKRLSELGYGLIRADGQFGYATQQAVWALQKVAGLQRDGVIGPKTKQALDAGVRPHAHTTSGKVVEVDLDRQVLMTVEDGHVTRILNASSGSGKKFETQGRELTANTPRGSFHIYNQVDGMHASTLELGDMYRPKYFTGGYAIHGAASVPPWPASHGCVRVSNGTIDWLWDTWGMPIGTRVVLY